MTSENPNVNGDNDPTVEDGNLQSCVPGLTRREFFGKLVKKAVIAGTLSVAISEANFFDQKAYAAASAC